MTKLRDGNQASPPFRFPRSLWGPPSIRADFWGAQASERSPQHTHSGRFLLRNEGHIQPRWRLSRGSGVGPWEPWDPVAFRSFGTSHRGRKCYLRFMSSHKPQKAEVKQSSVSLVCRDGKGFSRTGPPLRDEERRNTSGCHIYLERAFVFALDGGSWSTAGNVLSRTLPRPAKGAAGLTPRDPNSSLRTLRVPHHTPHSVLGCTKRSFLCLL